MDDKYLNENGHLKEGWVSSFVNNLVSKFFQRGETSEIEQLKQKYPEAEEELERMKQSKERIEDIIKRAEEREKATF